MKIGIYGGSFNPIHYGHLIPISSLLQSSDLDKIIFVPAKIPPHKRQLDLIDPEKRFEMVKIALDGFNGFEVSDYEIHLSNSPYTFDTLCYFQNQFPKDEIVLIIGYDCFLDLKSWMNWEGILNMFPIYVLKRICDNRQVCSEMSSKVNFVKSPVIEISSTKIRDMLKNNLPIKYLLPEKVENYIIDNKLYK